LTTFTLAFLASLSRQSATVLESSVTGNVLPSPSTFVSTPRSLNQPSSSAGVIPEGEEGDVGEMSSLAPRGYASRISPVGSAVFGSRLQRPPPEISTLRSGREEDS
jgi:hypothetical protein